MDELERAKEMKENRKEVKGEEKRGGVTLYGSIKGKQRGMGEWDGEVWVSQNIKKKKKYCKRRYSV